jgi:hypothetical protein
MCRLRGMMISTCCHHACSLETYSNLPFLRTLGLTNSEIVQLFASSAWFNLGLVMKNAKN